MPSQRIYGSDSESVAIRDAFREKHAVSNWILEHFSQFAFEYDDYISEEGKKDSLAVQLADLLIKGTHITWNENDTAAYYVWLDSWMKPYFQENPEMNERTIKHLGQFMDAFIRQLRSVKNPDENRVGRYMFAMGIKHMPEQYREALLQMKRSGNCMMKFTTCMQFYCLKRLQFHRTE